MHFTGGTKCCILLRKGKEHFGGGVFKGETPRCAIYPPFCVDVKHFWQLWESLRIFWTTLLTNVKCGRDKDIACSFILPLAVNKEHLCGHSLDNPVPCSCLKCLSIFLVFSIFSIDCSVTYSSTWQLILKVVISMCEVFQMKLYKPKWMKADDLVEWVSR